MRKRDVTWTRCRHLEFIIEKYEHLKFQALKNTNAILFLASHLNCGMDVLALSQTLFFRIISFIIL